MAFGSVLVGGYIHVPGGWMVHPNSTGKKLLCWDPFGPRPMYLSIRLLTYIILNILYNKPVNESKVYC